MPKKGGKRPGAGRKKGSQNKTTKEVRDLLQLHRSDLLKLAIKRAKEGSDAILNKLLDKILPTLQYNKNDDRVKTFEDWLKEIESGSEDN